MPPATAMRDVEVMADIPLPPPPPIYYRLTADARDAAVQCDDMEEPPELLPPPVPDYPCGKCGKCHGPRASGGPRARGVGKFSQGLRVSEDVQCCPMSTGLSDSGQ